MRHVSALPLKAVGFGRDRAAARMCLEATQAALLALPDFRRLYDLLRRELEAGDQEGPTFRFLQAMVDEAAEANLMAMGLDEPDSVSVYIDLEIMAVEVSCLEFRTARSNASTVGYFPDDDAASAAVPGTP